MDTIQNYLIKFSQAEILNITILTTAQDFHQATEQLLKIIESANLPLQYDFVHVDKLNNKTLKQFFTDKSDDNAVLIAEINKQNSLTCSLCTIEYDEKNKPTITKVSPEWHKLQRRIVTAGRKSELLLQACKINEDSKIIDATAGFGHDSLILASTLSNQLSGHVTMIEQNPVMALLLILERERMSMEKNWQGLMGRLDIRFGNAVELLLRTPLPLGESGKNETLFRPLARQELCLRSGVGRRKVDVIYLDPMFPNDSYEGAKVGKGMQVLHNLAKPPTLAEETILLNTAKSALNDSGRVVVKRPKNAPYLAGVTADESWANDVVRFDGYTHII